MNDRDVKLVLLHGPIAKEMIMESKKKLGTARLVLLLVNYILLKFDYPTRIDFDQVHGPGSNVS